MNTADFSFEIRVARLEDALAIAGLLGELGFPAPADVVAQRLSVLAKAGETTLVGARSGEVLGFVTVHVTPVLHRPAPVGRMTALVVATRARGRGLGRALVATAERRLADAGCGLMEVTSNQELSEAHSFYQQLGYAMTSYRFGKALPPSR
jgi:ribosomal protein S18 acetylase RimI-like enzyme